MWPLGYFRINGCNYCDDVYAEAADAVFMDAWLPEYKKAPGGTSLTLVRSELARALLEQGRQAGDLWLEPIDVTTIIEGQRSGLRRKREQLPMRLARARGRRRWLPIKRLAPHRDRDFVRRYRMAADLRRIDASRIAFARQRAGGPGLAVFWKELRRLTFRDRVVLRLLSAAQRVTRRGRK